MRGKNPYDELYSQIDMVERPFGYTKDYFQWRSSKLKGEFTKYITRNGKVLDIGGGLGTMAQFLPDFVDRKNYYNLEVSTEMLKYSPYNNIIAQSEDIPCPDNSFDYVILSEVLEHVNDKTMTLKESHRVLKPEGLFLLSTPRTRWINDFIRSPFRPFLIMEKMNVKAYRILNVFRSRKERFRIPKGIKDEPSDEKWLKETLERIGFRVLKQYRADNHVPWSKKGESKFWRWFADRFVNSHKYGHCTVVISVK